MGVRQAAPLQISYCTAMLIAAARASRQNSFSPEDLRQEQNLDDVRVTLPFVGPREDRCPARVGRSRAIPIKGANRQSEISIGSRSLTL